MRISIRRILIILAACLLVAGAPAQAAQKHKQQHGKAAAARTPPAPQPPPVPPFSLTPTLADISTMAAAGAPGLALKLVARDQPAFAQDAVGWMSWERQRIYLYQSSKAWGDIIARVQHLPAGLGVDFRQWEDMQAADAWLQLGHGREARAVLRALIWGKTPPADATLSQLRQLVIRSYLVDQRLDDAQTAVIRYRQDYPKDAGHWPLLEARLFLRTNQPQAALDALKDISGAQAGMLALLASLRAGTLAPAPAMEKAVSAGTDSKLPVDERVYAWFIAAEAAADLKNPVARIQALQNGIGLQSGVLEQDSVFALTPDMLWQAYLDYGEALGNQLQLVVGDDQAWFLAASNRFDSDPVRACALFTVVAFNASSAQQQNVAYWQIATLIQGQKNGDALLRHLYLDSPRFKDVGDIPPDVRYLLANDVLEIPDIPLASRLMEGLDAPPPDTDPVAWQLQRARVFILGGKPDAGIKTLQALFESGAKVDPGDVLPVLFDLQTIGRNKETIPFFRALLTTELTPDQRRQMLYWTADSYKASGDYTQAAALYLRSATLTDPFAMDQWAQTARYQAAQALAKAGDINDARRLYQGLLNATRDPGQQAVLRHDMQQLMLMPQMRPQQQ
ncbi:MAG: hypothetical protein KGJ56_01230 [Gammaproteobacteria bacterium]|nr:hypothetical protein [Gammaproteobacteria bacterium]